VLAPPWRIFERDYLSESNHKPTLLLSYAVISVLNGTSYAASLTNDYRIARSCRSRDCPQTGAETFGGDGTL